MRALLASLMFVAACDGSSATAADSATSCTCKALGVSFDKTSSGLGAMNVQDALDELAARPVAEAPVGGRIQTVVKTFPNPGTKGGVSQTLDCPDPAHDIALGGACGFVDNATLGETIITNDASHASYACSWLQPNGSPSNMRVTVVCLTKAR
jgi:hypothetical protein